jgi:hypothetical protein
MSTRLECFPNELLFCIFEYIDAVDLYYGFWGLNKRFNQHLQSLRNLSLTLEKDESKLISLFGHQIIRLVIDTCLDVDFSQFPYLHSLILYQVTKNHLKQIQSDIMPYLTYLSILSNDDYFLVPQLTQRIFSQALSSLHYVNLSHLGESMYQWSQSHSLHSIYAHCSRLIMVQYILAAAPNLSKLHVIFERKYYSVFDSIPSTTNHPLKYFILTDPFRIFGVEDIYKLLTLIPNVQRIQLSFNCDIPFIHFLRILSSRLSYLNRFDCHIDEAPDDEAVDIEIIREIRPCFNRIQYTTDDYGYRTYTTD